MLINVRDVSFKAEFKMPRGKKSSKIGRRFKSASEKKRFKHLEKLHKKEKTERYLRIIDKAEEKASQKVALISELDQSIAERQYVLECLTEEVQAAAL